jgi:hypothetical protein
MRRRRMQVAADIRTIESTVYATKYSLRFPRVKAVRCD